MSTESQPIDARNYLQPQMRQQGYNASSRYSQYPAYVEGHPQNYPAVSMPNTPIPSPSSCYRIRKSSDPVTMLYHNRGGGGATVTATVTDPMAHMSPSSHSYASSSSHNQQGGSRGLELRSMPPPPPSNEVYNSMNMNWSSYRPDPRLPATAGPHDTSFSVPSTQQRSNYQNHHRHHSDPRHDETTVSYTHTHLPPIMQTPMMNSYSPSQAVPPGESDITHHHSTDVSPFEDSYRGGGGHHHDSMHQGLLEHNSMRMPGYHPSNMIQEPRGVGDNNDQFNNVPMGSNFNMTDLTPTCDRWNTYK